MQDLKLQLTPKSEGRHLTEGFKHGERHLVYACATLAASVGAGIVSSFMTSNPMLGLGVGGAALCASAGYMILRLNEEKSQHAYAIKQDIELISNLANISDKAMLVTNLRGEFVAGNNSYNQMGAEKRRPIASLLDIEDSDVDIARMRAEVTIRGSYSKIYPSNRFDLGDLQIIATLSGKHILWQLNPLATSLRAASIIDEITQKLEPIISSMDMGLALVSVEGNLLYANDKLRTWLNLSQNQSLPVKLRLKDHSTRLVVDEKTIHDVQVFMTSVPIDKEEEAAGQIIIMRNLDGFAGLRSNSSGNIIEPLVDAAPIGVAVVDASGNLEDANQRMQTFGQSLGFAKYDNILDIIKSEHHNEFLDLLDRVSQGQVIRRPYDVRFKGESEKVGQFYFSTLKTEEKRVIILYMIDMSQQKSIEKQFVQAQKMQAVGQLAGGVAHDFNNLLTAIIGFCDLSLARHEAGDTTFSDLMNIKQNANRASNLVRQLLAFSRQQTLRPKVLSISDVIAELSNLVRRLIGENITLEIKHGRDISPIKVDQGQLEQVIINLAVNARDAMPQGGTLTISTRTVQSDDPLLDRFEVIVPSEYVLVELLDTGTGIEDKHAEQIFEPFYTTKDVGKGTGLGLATVYGIVKQTGGYVFFDSEVGKGTNFMIFLKAHHEEEDHTVVEKVAPKVVKDLTGQGTILLVEDEDAVRLFTTRALTNKGYKVIGAATGEEGLEQFEKNADDIKLLITDVIMPAMDGPTLVRAAKKINQDLQVLFISGYAEDVVRKDIEDDTCHFLPKPFSLIELAETVKTIIP